MTSCVAHCGDEAHSENKEQLCVRRTFRWSRFVAEAAACSTCSKTPDVLRSLHVKSYFISPNHHRCEFMELRQFRFKSQSGCFFMLLCLKLLNNQNLALFFFFFYIYTKIQSVENRTTLLFHLPRHTGEEGIIAARDRP